VDSEKLDVAVIIFVTTDMTDKKANKVIFTCINAETSETIPVLPGVLEVTNGCRVEALCEDFTGGFEVGNLQRSDFETHVSEVCWTHCGTNSLGGWTPSIFGHSSLHSKYACFSHTKLRLRYTGDYLCTEVWCTAACCIRDNQVGNG
jgi:hypothetical protein